MNLKTIKIHKIPVLDLLLRRGWSDLVLNRGQF